MCSYLGALGCRCRCNLQLYSSHYTVLHHHSHNTCYIATLVHELAHNSVNLIEFLACVSDSTDTSTEVDITGTVTTTRGGDVSTRLRTVPESTPFVSFINPCFLDGFVSSINLLRDWVIGALNNLISMACLTTGILPT